MYFIRVTSNIHFLNGNCWRQRHTLFVHMHLAALRCVAFSLRLVLPFGMELSIPENVYIKTMIYLKKKTSIKSLTRFLANPFKQEKFRSYTTLIIILKKKIFWRMSMSFCTCFITWSIMSIAKLQRERKKNISVAFWDMTHTEWPYIISVSESLIGCIFPTWNRARDTRNANSTI